MPEEKRMSSINWSLKHLECLLNLDSHEELLSFVLREKWFPEGTKYQLSEEDIDFIKNFHKWSTGQELLSQPTIDPPICEAGLAHWRVVSTIINYIGEEKVNIAEHDSNEQPKRKSTLLSMTQMSSKDSQLLSTTQVNSRRKLQ